MKESEFYKIDFDSMQPEIDSMKSFAEAISIYGEERKGGVTGKKATGNIDNTRIFDTTFREALETMSAGTVSNLAPQTEAWFDVESQKFNPSSLEKSAFNHIGDRLRTRIGQSNFYRAFHEAVHSGNMFGTFCICMKKGKKKPFNFTEIPFGKFRFRENEDGVPDYVYHEWEEKTATQIYAYFRDELKDGSATLHEKVEKAATSNDPKERNQKFKVVHYVGPRNPDEVVDGIAVESKRAYESVYFLPDLDHIIRKGGLYYQPYIVTRMLKSRHDGGFGRSSGTQIYPIVRMINRAVRDVGVAIEKTVFPSILHPNDSAFQYDNRPNGRIPFDANRPNSKPEPFHENPNIQNAEYFITRLERQIKAACFNDIFKFFTNSDIAKTRKTAYEVQIQAEEQLQLFTPIFLNIIDECTNRIVENAFTQMFIDREFDDIEGMEEVSNFSVTYNSRLALAVRAQKTNAALKLAALAERIEQFAQGAASRAVNWEGIFKQAAIDSTVDAKYVNSDDTISQLKKKDNQILELSTMLEQMQMATQSMANAGAQMMKTA